MPGVTNYEKKHIIIQSQLVSLTTGSYTYYAVGEQATSYKWRMNEYRLSVVLLPIATVRISDKPLKALCLFCWEAENSRTKE
jgi:hypothetical protein